MAALLIFGGFVGLVVSLAVGARVAVNEAAEAVRIAGEARSRTQHPSS